jgi:hypothetical protein
MAEAQKEAFRDALAGSFATKSDIARIELDLPDIKAEQKTMRWMLGFLLAGMVALLIKAFASLKKPGGHPGLTAARTTSQ